MSVRLMSMVFFAREITSTEKLVLLALADYANDDGLSIYPSVETLAAKTALNERTIQRVIGDLETRGIVKTTIQGNGRYKTNEYAIFPPELEKLCHGKGGTRSSFHEQKGGVRSEKGDRESQKGGVRSEKGDRESQKGGVRSEKGGTESPDPSLTIIKPSEKQKSHSTTSTSTDFVNWQLGTAAQCERLYTKITAQVAIPPSQSDNAMRSLEAILDYYKGDIEAAYPSGRRVFLEWCSTQGKSGKTYSRTNTAWLERWLGTLAPEPLAVGGADSEETAAAMRAQKAMDQLRERMRL